MKDDDDYYPTNDVCPHCQKKDCILNDVGVYCRTCKIQIVKLSKKQRKLYEDIVSGAAQLRLAKMKRTLDEWRAANVKPKR